MHVRRALGLALPLVLVGCAAYQPAPVPSNHPAHLGAPAAPARPRSQTLAYSASDVPSVQPVPSVAAPSGDPHHSGAAPAASSRTVVGEGEVVTAVQGSSQIVVEHGEIKGFMGAMTMGYRVDPPALLAGLNEGDKIRFTIDVQRRAIVKIEKLP